MRKSRIKNPTKTKKNCHLRASDIYEVVDGVKLLLGYSNDELETHIKMRDFYKSLLPNPLFGTLTLSTIAGIGKVPNVEFNEERVMHRLKFVDGVASVAGANKKIKNPASGDTEVHVVKTFRCQVTVEVVSLVHVDKVYKIKIFRNGTVHIPGIMRGDMHDIIKPMRTVCSFLEKTLMHDNIEVEFIKSTMQNFNCVLKNDSLGIIISELKRCMLIEYELKKVSIESMANLHNRLTSCVGSRGAFIFFKYVKWTSMPIKLPKRNAQKTSGILIKLDRYEENEKKDLTIRVLTSGKITFNGGNSQIEVESSYYWLNYILSKYYEDVIFDPVRNHAFVSEDIMKLSIIS